MRILPLLIGVLLGLAPWSLDAATAKKKPTPVAEEASLEDLLGKDLASAIEAAGSAYDKAQAALQRDAKRKRSEPNRLIREIGGVRDEYEKALERARNARLEGGDSLLRDQVVVSVSQSIRACDLITQGLRDDDDGPMDAGVELAAMAQADLDRLAEGGDPAEIGGDEPVLGPSLGMNVGMSSQASTFNMNMDINVSVPVSKAQDVGLGGTLNASSQQSSTSPSGSMNLGGNIFSRYHFLQAFPASPQWVPYVGAKTGMTWGTQWQGKGLALTITDTLSVDLAGQLGMLVFMNKQTAVTMQIEIGSSSSSSDNGTKVSTSTSSSTGLSLGLRRMF